MTVQLCFYDSCIRKAISLNTNLDPDYQTIIIYNSRVSFISVLFIGMFSTLHNVM